MQRTKAKTLGFLAAILAMIMFLSGCMAFDVSLTIEEGGSGELVYDVLWEPQYGENSEESIPEGTEYIPAVTIDEVSYTGYRVRREFSDPEELKAILTEQAGAEEVFSTGEADEGENSLLTQAQAFRLGNFISGVSYEDDAALQRVTLTLTFTPIDLSGMVGTDENGESTLSNEDIFTLYFNIDMPGNILSAAGDRDSVQVEYDENSASFKFSPDRVEETVITLVSDYSNNTYIYSDRPVPDESYTYSGDREANKALDKATAEKYGMDNMADSPAYIVLYLVGAGIVIIAIVLICVFRLRSGGSGSGDRAYDRKLERDLRNEEARISQQSVKATRNKPSGKKSSAGGRDNTKNTSKNVGSRNIASRDTGDRGSGSKNGK